MNRPMTASSWDILIVDDDVYVVKALERVLRPFCRHVFDVVEALQRNADTARIPILVVTAKQITALDRAVLNSNPGKVIHIVEKAGFNRLGFIADVRRALLPH